MPNLERLRQAAAFLVAGTYSEWSKGIAAFKAMAAAYPSGAARDLAVAFGMTSPPDSTRGQLSGVDSRYNPGAFFDGLSPVLAPSVAAAVVLGMARDAAVGVVREAFNSRVTPPAEDAARYLSTWHRTAWKQLVAAEEKRQQAHSVPGQTAAAGEFQ
jgi:hypothetical protein